MALLTTREAHLLMAEKGLQLCKEPVVAVFVQSVFAGFYVGFASMLAVVLAGNMPGLTEENPGLKSLIFAACFPFGLFYIMFGGGVLYTAVTYTGAAAWTEGKLGNRGLLHFVKILLITAIGNPCGSVALAAFITAIGLNTGGTAAYAVELTTRKCHMDWGSVVGRAVLCNWMISMALLISAMTPDLPGKFLATFLPVLTFVACGYEYFCVNAFVLPLGLLAGAPATVGDVMLRNWLPAALGHLLGGGLVMGGGYCLLVGSLSKRVQGLQDPFQLTLLPGKAQFEVDISVETMSGGDV